MLTLLAWFMTMLECCSGSREFFSSLPRYRISANLRLTPSRTLPLTRNNEGQLTATLPIPHGSKITFKVTQGSCTTPAERVADLFALQYIVDGAWQHNPNEPFEDDGHGNINNVFQGELGCRAGCSRFKLTQGIALQLPTRPSLSRSVRRRSPSYPFPTRLLPPTLLL